MIKKWVLIWSIIFTSTLFADAKIDSTLIYPDTFNIKNPDHYIDLSAFYINSGKLENAKTVIEDGLKLGEKTKNLYLTSNLSYFQADYYYYIENYAKAHELYFSVLPLFYEQKDTLMIAKALNSIGLIYELNQDYENSLKYYTEDVKMLQKVHNKTKQFKTEELVVFSNLNNLYSYTEEFHKIIENADKTIQLANELNDTQRLANFLNTLGTAYRHIPDFEKSLETYRSAISIFNKLNDEFRRSFIFNNIGVLFEEVKVNYDSAFHYYNLALKGFKEAEYNYGIVNAQVGIASILSKKNQIANARTIYTQLIDTALQYGFQGSLLSAYLGLSQLEYNARNFKDAFDLRVKYNTINDSLFTAEKHRQYAELETKFQISQKEVEINNLKNEKLKQDLILKRNNLYKQLAFIIAVILLITVTIISLFFNEKRKALLMLTIKNEQIENQNEQLKQMNHYIQQINEKLIKSQKELENVNNAQKRFFSILAHDLRNPFHAIMGQSYLLSKNYDSFNNIDRVTYANNIFDASEQTNRLLENLLEWSRTQVNGIKFQPSRFVYRETIENALSVLSKNAQSKSISIINTVTAEMELDADRSMIETIIRNMVNNSIKFSHQGGKITISCREDNNLIVTCIEDFGIGIPESNIFKLFDIDANIKTLGTNNEKGTGLGLVICKEFVNFHKGDIWVESKPGIGTRFFFSIPLNI